MKILFSADHHIKLKAKLVPEDWQINRFCMLGEALHKIFIEHECDLHIIGGDLLDVANPSPAEHELMSKFLSLMPHKGLIYSGNHEAITKKKSCLYHYADNIESATDGNWRVVKSPYRSNEFDIIDYMELHKKEWEPAKSSICFTHVRGAIEPHVIPEIDLMRFVRAGYYTVYAGDLHSNKNSQSIDGTVELLYPGSPMTTSFHRERNSEANGVFIIDTEKVNYDWIWVDLSYLPQLIRKTVSSKEDIVKTDYDHTVYEVEGDVLDLKSLNTDSEIFDKKINTVATKDAKLNLANLTIVEEVSLYLTEIQGLSAEKVAKIIGRVQPYVKDNT